MDQQTYFDQFDHGPDRNGTGCLKWDAMSRIYGREGLLPLWVADMDFESPACVREALVARAAHGIYGYPEGEEGAINAACAWMEKRHGLRVAPEQALLSPGVVDSLAMAICAYTSETDTVVVQPPIYGPFEFSVKNTGRRIAYNPLKHENGVWTIDLEDLESHFKQGAKMLLFCSPHNPTGRVWSPEELRSVSDLCRRYSVRLITDEIHADIELPGHHHTPILSVDDTAIAFISATKTFNLAGLRCSTMLFGRDEDKKAMQAYLTRIGQGEVNIFGMLAQQAAYEGGAEWLDALLQYIAETDRQVNAFVKAEMPGVGITELQGTYLKWLDFSCLGMDQEALRNFMVHKCGVALTGGDFFTRWGTGFMRVNLATPRANVMRGLKQIAEQIRLL